MPTPALSRRTPPWPYEYDTPFAGMRFLRGALFQMGWDGSHSEEAPARCVHVDDFWIDATPVTNAQFEQFVDATGYVTFAELAPAPVDYQGAPVMPRRAGSLVFAPPSKQRDSDAPLAWWRLEPGADWRHPLGPDSSIVGLEDHPVVHIACPDAQAFAAWAGKQLPTEAEWEYAARGGLVGAEYAWGDELAPAGRIMANTWVEPTQPIPNRDRIPGTSPVRSFPCNGYGLYDMIGNVWEWTDDWYLAASLASGCVDKCTWRVLQSGNAAPGARVPQKILKGGSFAYDPRNDGRYRPAARRPERIDCCACHIGFRCVVRLSQI